MPFRISDTSCMAKESESSFAEHGRVSSKNEDLQGAASSGLRYVQSDSQPVHVFRQTPSKSTYLFMVSFSVFFVNVP